MIALDTNLLVYGHRIESPHHQAAKACIASLAKERAPWAIPWPCLHEFYGVVTHHRVYKTPTPAVIALNQIEAWLSATSVVLLHESAQHWQVLRALIESAAVAGPMVHDARIAALCLQHGVRELWSADRDFKRFSSLAVRNPLVA